ncbi:MAG: hypothetical protein M1829_004376 [Trizodia sp. TS-e1964]|nr:MAG: hypothetical protein M1829_004376 [Trizodia sp. TS-e1964]
MARRQHQPQQTEQIPQGKRPSGNEKKPPTTIRRSTRLQIQNSAMDIEVEAKLPSTKNPLQAQGLKRKREREPEDAAPTAKRLQTSVGVRKPLDILAKKTTGFLTERRGRFIDKWRKEGNWPEEFFAETKANKELDAVSWLQDMKADSQFTNQIAGVSRISQFIARLKPSPSTSTRQQTSQCSDGTLSDIRLMKAKGLEYKTPAYGALLASKGSFMANSKQGISKASKALCETLLESEQSVPGVSLFQGDLLEKTCQKLTGRNQALVARDISLLIVPSAQTLATFGATKLQILMESAKEGWRSTIPVMGPLPQPDYSVGFGRSAFTKQQVEKLRPFVGDLTDNFSSFFMATWQIYFPFLTCEIKCGTQSLDVADRANAHSMTVAVRGVVELFRMVKREKELNREMLAFSVSHNDRFVRIYGHYAMTNKRDTTYYRHPIHSFDITALDGRERWTAYKFTKNVYDIWMPQQLKRICSAIDQIPAGIDFGLTTPSMSLDLESQREEEGEETEGDNDVS